MPCQRQEEKAQLNCGRYFYLPSRNKTDGMEHWRRSLEISSALWSWRDLAQVIPPHIEPSCSYCKIKKMAYIIFHWHSSSTFFFLIPLNTRQQWQMIYTLFEAKAQTACVARKGRIVMSWGCPWETWWMRGDSFGHWRVLRFGLAIGRENLVHAYPGYKWVGLGKLPSKGKFSLVEVARGCVD